MKQILTAIIILCTSASSLPAYQNLSAEQLLTLLTTNDSLVLVDVRELNEYSAGHIEGAHLFPLNSTLLTTGHTQLPSGYPLAFYCGSGFRSAQAVAFMDTVNGGAYAGYIYNLIGGIGGWPYDVITGGQFGAEIATWPDPLLFDNKTLGSETELSITLINNALQGAAVVLVPALETQAFSVSADTVTLPRGDSLQVGVKFHPTDFSVYSESVLLHHGGAGYDTLSVLLQGSATEAMAGDIDINGRIDILDLLELLKELSGKSNVIGRERMDINDDGVLNIFDLLRLLLLIRAAG